MKKYVLISKDAMCCDYLPLYSTRKCRSETPNIDELAAKGTLFENYYTAAPSTVMSFFSMCTGVFAHQTDYQMYEKKRYPVGGETLFTKLKALGYEECHLIWDPDWNIVLDYFDFFRDDVKIYSFEGFRERVGVHKKTNGELFYDADKEAAIFEKTEKLISDLIASEKSTFIWIHFPHVISGHACYGADISLFDRYVGMIRKYVDDDCIAITADHGNMNGSKGKLAYGHDVYNKAIRIPLITPRIDNLAVCKSNISSVDLFDILFAKKIPEREFVYSDSAYRAQKNRKLAIMYGKYKYIYNKKTKTEELYDLEYDPDEDFSIMYDNLFDVDRKITLPIREQYYYPDWAELPAIREKLSEHRKQIWRNGSLPVVIKSGLKDFVRPAYRKLMRLLKK